MALEKVLAGLGRRRDLMAVELLMLELLRGFVVTIVAFFPIQSCIGLSLELIIR